MLLIVYWEHSVGVPSSQQRGIIAESHAPAHHEPLRRGSNLQSLLEI